MGYVCLCQRIKMGVIVIVGGLLKAHFLQGRFKMMANEKKVLGGKKGGAREN